jgi:AhpD family alkylhydroperoxidase
MQTQTKPHARINNIAGLFPDVIAASQAVTKSVASAGLPQRTAELVQLRASQINGCSVCVDGHSKALKKSGESDERLLTCAAWRDTPYFTDAERAALALAEAVTRLSDSPDPVPDAVWDEAARYYDERQLAALVVQIAVINMWNRFNVATRQPAGIWGGE